MDPGAAPFRQESSTSKDYPQLGEWSCKLGTTVSSKLRNSNEHVSHATTSMSPNIFRYPSAYNRRLEELESRFIGSHAR